MTAAAPDWPCEAYGPGGLDFGARCFTAAIGERSCDSPGTCHQVMTATRADVFERMQTLAAAGDPLFTWLAQEFTSPDQILSGGDAGDPD